MEEKDILIKNQEDRIYELDYVNNSLDEIKEYFAEQLREYKKKELSDVNERLNESYKSIAEKEAQINTLSRTIDDYKIKVIKLENDVEAQTHILELEKQTAEIRQAMESVAFKAEAGTGYGEFKGAKPGNRFCTNCGAPLVEGQSFCVNCGAKL